MAMQAKRKRRVQFKVHARKITGKARTANRKAMAALAKEMTKELRDVLSVQTGKYGPPAPPGEPPRRRSGYLQKTTKVEHDAAGRVIVRTPNYGIWLDGGTGRMAARPFLRKTIHDMKPHWNRRYRYYMRRFSK